MEEILVPLNAALLLRTIAMLPQIRSRMMVKKSERLIAAVWRSFTLKIAPELQITSANEAVEQCSKALL